MNNPKVKVFETHARFVEHSADFIRSMIKESENYLTIALSGGSTPVPIYNKLASNIYTDFNRVIFLQVDERYVPSSHKKSNYRMIYSSLIGPISHKLRQFISFDTDKPIEECVKDYNQKVMKIAQNGIDLTILGIGPDGHYASLFPGSILHYKTPSVAHTTTDVFDIRDRLTLTKQAIMKSKNILILMTGEDKKETLKTLLDSNKSEKEFPAKALLNHESVTIFYAKNKSED